MEPTDQRGPSAGRARVMVDRASLWPKVSEHANRLLHLLENRGFEGPARDAAVVLMFWRTQRLYEAALILLKAHLPEEASIIVSPNPK
jgi:hypothetical protein